MQIIDSPAKMQKFALDERSKGRTIGFVPTMGALHEGHASLMDIARGQCDILVVSIYVNPLQFGPTEDLDTYPHTPDADHQVCQDHKVDVVFRPSTLYSTQHSTTVSIANLTTGLCGASRPTHFDGVTTVVARLFGIVQPHLAVFGQKDFQQLAIIKRMVSDLAMPIQIVGGAIKREEDGLALSSRNTYLSPTDRKRALSLSKSLTMVQECIYNGVDSVDVLTQAVKDTLDVDRIDYISFVDPDTLQPVSKIEKRTQLCLAAFLGSTRLIDNHGLSLPSQMDLS